MVDKHNASVRSTAKIGHHSHVMIFEAGCSESVPSCQEIPDSAALMASYSKLTVLKLAAACEKSKGSAEQLKCAELRWRNLRRSGRGCVGESSVDQAELVVVRQ